MKKTKSVTACSAFGHNYVQAYDNKDGKRTIFCTKCANIKKI